MDNKTPSKWNTISDELHADCRIFEVRKHSCKHPIDKREGDFFVITSNDWVNVVPVTCENEIIFVRQYRFGTQQLSWEIPGGVIDQQECPLLAGARELDEETGYVGNQPKAIGKCYPNPALFTNICHFILIENAKQVNKQNLDRHEEIEIKLVSIHQASQWLHSQDQPVHAMTLNALYFAKQHLNGL